MSKHIGAFLLLLVLAACGGGNGTATSPSPTPTPTTPTVTTFSLTGQVTDGATSAAISGATVSIGDGVNSGKSTTTSPAGTYAFSALQQAGFTLTVSATDYVSTSKGVTLTSNQTVSFQLVRAGPRTTFGAGQYLVGTDIAAGRYFSAPSNGCYWERQSGLGGTLGEIIANDFIGFNAAQWIVDIRSSDRAFKTDADCGTWYNTPRQGAQASIPPGVWLVGSQNHAGHLPRDCRIRLLLGAAAGLHRDAVRNHRQRLHLVGGFAAGIHLRWRRGLLQRRRLRNLDAGERPDGK